MRLVEGRELWYGSHHLIPLREGLGPRVRGVTFQGGAASPFLFAINHAYNMHINLNVCKQILIIFHNSFDNNTHLAYALSREELSMAETLGERIRRARMGYGMSQAELARRIHISTQGMNLIESGKTPDPAASRVRAISKVLKVSADYLLGLTDKDESGGDRDESEILTAVAV